MTLYPCCWTTKLIVLAYNGAGYVSNASCACLLALVMLAPGSCHSPGTGDLKTPEPGSEAALALGIWGGDHVRMEVQETEVAIEFDCAHASLPIRPELDEKGRFQSDGIYVQEKPGPAQPGDESSGHPARFEGAVDGRKLSLSITLNDTKETLGPFTLTLGEETRLAKCL